MIDERTKKALSMLKYKIVQCIERDDFSTDDLEDMFVLCQTLLTDKSRIKVFLSWLANLSKMEEVQQVAGKWQWALRLFSSAVEKFK